MCSASKFCETQASERDALCRLTDVERQHAVGGVGLRGLELQRWLLQPQDVGENVLVQARDQLQLRRPR